jgi:hypothetical protein
MGLYILEHWHNFLLSMILNIFFSIKIINLFREIRIKIQNSQISKNLIKNIIFENLDEINSP